MSQQTEPADEIVVCDDGSTDDLHAAIENCDLPITFVRQPNRGLAAARNTGVANVQGCEWVLFLDADDWLDPTCLERLRDATAAHPEIDIWALDAVGIDDASGDHLYRQYERESFPLEGQRKALLEHNFILTPSVRREAFLRVGGFDERLRRCEDWECWMRMVLAGSVAGLAPGATFYRRHHPDSLSSSWLEMQRARIHVLTLTLDRPELLPDEAELVRRTIRTHYRTLRRREGQQLAARWAAASKGKPGVGSKDRRIAWRLVRQRETPPRLRMLLLAGVLAPTIAGRWYARLRAEA